MSSQALAREIGPMKILFISTRACLTGVVYTQEIGPYTFMNLFPSYIISYLTLPTPPLPLVP